MDEATAAPSDSRSILAHVLWLIAAIAVFVVWTTMGFFALMPLDAVVPVGGPERAPMWLVYSGLVFLGFLWPLLLLVLTRRLKVLNRMLMAVYVVSAIGFVVGGNVVVFARTLDAPMQRALAASLVTAAVALNGWSNQRIKLTATRV